LVHSPDLARALLAAGALFLRNVRAFKICAARIEARDLVLLGAQCAPVFLWI
jgi:hypothetical protein